MFTLTEKQDGTWTRNDVCFGDDNVCSNGLVNTYQNHILSFGEDQAGDVTQG